MNTTENLDSRMIAASKFLKLPTIKSMYIDAAKQARRKEVTHEAYLVELLEQEAQLRQQKRIERMLRESRLPLEKTLETFDRSRLPHKINTQLNVLIEGDFLRRTENILVFGNPGSGKTHLICAIAHELIHRGYRILFSPCSILVQHLLAAKKELTLPKFLTRLLRFDALIIDDIGYVQQSREEMEVLFTLLAERYERGSVLLTSNLPFSKWENIFKDPMTTAAAIDRLVHHSVILELNLSSFRLEASQKPETKKKQKS